MRTIVAILPARALSSLAAIAKKSKRALGWWFIGFPWPDESKVHAARSVLAQVDTPSTRQLVEVEERALDREQNALLYDLVWRWGLTLAAAAVIVLIAVGQS